jgi:2-polyprenyl-3-methyl-5-hydroxy-6-metoxy-1,4-benzoquinol methylase
MAYDTPVPEYYRADRLDIIRYIPPAARQILDVGCGTGGIARHLAYMERQATVIGVEHNAEAAAQASEVMAHVYVGDVEELDLPFTPRSFDCIVYGDVLEHLRDPWTLLRRQRVWLRSGGCAIVSLPNVQFYAVLWGLLQGRWEYQERGVMDRSHLRFFTYRSAAQLLVQAGYRVEQCQRNFRFFEQPWAGHRYARLLGSLPPLKPFLTHQFIFRALPVDS